MRSWPRSYGTNPGSSFLLSIRSSTEDLNEPTWRTMAMAEIETTEESIQCKIYLLAAV